MRTYEFEIFDGHSSVTVQVKADSLLEAWAKLPHEHPEHMEYAERVEGGEV